MGDTTAVKVTVKGLDWSTPDHLLLEYLQLWGEVEQPRKVMYEKYATGQVVYEGNLLTGDRSVRLKLGKKYLPKMHLLQGRRVEISYPGQRECYRCLHPPRDCMVNLGGVLWNVRGKEEKRFTGWIVKNKCMRKRI